MNWNMLWERRLLQRCAQDDPLALQEFARQSYVRQIHRTATETNLQYNGVLDGQELQDLCEHLAIEIYDAYKTIPDWREDLYKRIHQYVKRATEEYIYLLGAQ